MSEARTAYTTNERDYKGGCYRRNVIDSSINSRITDLETASGTQSGLAVIAVASSTLTLTNSYTAVPGAAFSITRAGLYLFTATIDFTVIGSDTGVVFSARIVTGLGPPTIAQAALAVYVGGTAGDRATVSQQWIVQMNDGSAVALQAQKASGTGTSICGQSNTQISGLWISG